MSNPFQLTFTLKQHTPIIHFQHDQEGATLRASEVKPKLDRFIIQKMKEENKPVPDSWYNNKEKGSLDYKLRIEPTISKKIVVGNRMVNGKPSQSKVLAENGYDSIEFSGYFAQEKEIGDLFVNKKYKDEKGKNVNSFSAKDDFTKRINELNTLGVYCSQPIKISIICFNSELKKKINDSVNCFFVSHSFGTRQTKGFGCFLPETITDEQIINCLKSNSEIKGIFKVSDTTDYKTKLGRINKEYTILKRGDSFNTYIKSKLWEFVCASSKLNWEKKSIKLHIKKVNTALFNQLKIDTKKAIHSSGHHIDSCSSENNDYYVRALLGLAEQYEFAKNYGNDRIKVTVKDHLTFSTIDSLKHKAIDRFTSPIRYFITDTSIFISTTSIPHELIYYNDESGVRQNRKFRFTIYDLKANKSIDLPVPNNFDLEKFIESKANYGKNLK